MDPFDFVNRENAEYIDRLYQQYQLNPKALDERWRAFFAGFDAATALAPPGAASAPAAGSDEQVLQSGVNDLIHAYRELGHFVSKIDPLGHNRPRHPLLELSEFSLSLADLDRRIGNTIFKGSIDGTLRDLIEKLRTTYCRTIGVEYMDISDKGQRSWLQERMEPILNQPRLSPGDRKAILYQIVAAQGFEEFLHTRYVGQKRFSLEGGEALVPLLNTLIEDGAELGIEEIVMGMAHRGRLNVLAHVLNKPYEIILSEFEGSIVSHDDEGDGDVKYHLGYSNNRRTEAGRRVHISLSFNPSHLELVNPVVVGIVRGKQVYKGDTERRRVIPVLIHGDAAFTGQGIVHETLGLSELPYYRTGGTIHVIINNQIGFTTLPRQGRFTPYPTDVAKMIQAPIFHVNADDPEAVVHAARLAVAFRQEFKCDVFIDLWCYRRHGHNETDEPTFTQPVMYRQISKHPAVREIYSTQLMEQGIVSNDDLEQMKKDALQRLENAHELAKEVRPRQKFQSLSGVWTGMTRASTDWSAHTAVAGDTLKLIGERATTVPDGFAVHPKLKRLFASRRDMSAGKAAVDWGCAEMLALGSLALEGTPVRFTGQDGQRGTFSHRHAALRDYNNGSKYVPLDNLSKDQAPIIFVNTMLSELAVLGFEYGLSSADPRFLIVWEAQFGDFVNGAQPIIDQFLVAAESKWQKMSGLVMLLPHGYEGQGPEHSSGYLERFLQLCAEDNIQVCNLSETAQHFHALRRQIHRTFRKPLIIMSPKSLLRYEPSFSRIEAFTDGAFQLVIDDPAAPQRDHVRRVLLCSGKVYYTLAAAREKEEAESREIVLVRVEQLYPFPRRELQQILAKYRHVEEIGWIQEEPKNRGAWTFMEPRLRELLPDNTVLSYYGRDEAASPATGSYKVHQIEERELVSAALELPTRRMPSGPPEAAPTPTSVSQ
jgi:2-oxoglutarate dehydrogenase E1 component